MSRDNALRFRRRAVALVKLSNFQSERIAQRHPQAVPPGARRAQRFGAMVGTVLFFIWYEPAPTQLRLSGASAEIGTGHGHALPFRMKLATRIYLDRIICGGDKALILAWRAKAMASMTNWPPVYTIELVAMATAAGMDLGALAYGNCFLDLGNAKAGCRSLVVATNDLLLHAHYLDLDNLGGLGRWTTCIIRWNGELCRERRRLKSKRG